MLHTAILKINAFENLAVSWLPVLVVSSSTELRVLSNRSVHGDIARVSLRSSVVVPSSHVLAYYTFLSLFFFFYDQRFRSVISKEGEKAGLLKKINFSKGIFAKFVSLDSIILNNIAFFHYYIRVIYRNKVR